MDLLLTPAAPVAPAPAAITRHNPVQVLETAAVIPVRVDPPATQPSTLSQQGAVTRSRLIGDAGGAETALPVGRVLKPFGVAMLPKDRPEGAAQHALAFLDPEEEETARDPALSATVTGSAASHDPAGTARDDRPEPVPLKISGE